MKNLALLSLLVLLPGCAIEKFNQPPTWASAVATHTRFFGIDASIPVSSGATVGVKLGWGSVTWEVIPVSTNRVYAAPINDTFSLGQQLNPFDTQITEDIQSGWFSNTNATIPRYPDLFHKKSLTSNTNAINKTLVSPKNK